MATAGSILAIEELGNGIWKLICEYDKIGLALSEFRSTYPELIITAFGKAREWNVRRELPNPPFVMNTIDVEVIVVTTTAQTSS
jgi:hypothetical protein